MENNLIRYYRVVLHHREFMGFCRPCNIYELMHRMGSERGFDNYEKVVIDDYFVSYIRLSRFPNCQKQMKLTLNMINAYPWLELADSIKKNGMKIPAVVELIDKHRVIALEGKHRVSSVTLIEPYNKDYPVRSILVRLDPFYTYRMFKKPHPNPFRPEGYIEFENR